MKQFLFTHRCLGSLLQRIRALFGAHNPVSSRLRGGSQRREISQTESSSSWPAAVA